MQTRNNYDHDVFNGDVGEVEDVAGGICTVRFGTQRIALSGPELDDLTLPTQSRSTSLRVASIPQW